MGKVSLAGILDSILLAPLRLLFELLFGFAYEILGEAGWAIIVLSIAINLILLPFYRQADKIQAETLNKERALAKGVRHIRKTFAGEERMMMLHTYYRQNDYKQTDALRASMALLLEIPFFIAAYQFLSRLDLLEGMSFGAIDNLAAPDALLQVASLQINVLPLFMTLFNILSAVIYTRQATLRNKIQLYAMAGFFLIFLYNSPAALLLYWTLNNLISLFKNLLEYVPWKKLVTTAFNRDLDKQIADNNDISPKFPAGSRHLFLAAAALLTVLSGVLIPSTFIAASPQEYIDIYYYAHPVLFILTSFCLASGVFLIWLPMFYRLSSAKAKCLIGRLLYVLAGSALLNYMFFGKNLGVISAGLQYEETMSFLPGEQVINIVVILVLAALLLLVLRLIGKRVVVILLLATISFGAMSAYNLFTIDKSIRQLDLSSQEGLSSALQTQPHFSLSKKGNNVVVMMFDRAMGSMLPYMLNEKPELEQQFSGFTYYPNTISFGNSTNIAVPALLGGYEYTPVEINRRKDEALVDKHNEALKIMPIIFAENGYEVTICDPPYANYRWVPDLSIFNTYPHIKPYITKGKFSRENQSEINLRQNHRNFFLFSIMKTLPLSLQKPLYDQGNYRQLPSQEGKVDYSSQTLYSISKASGFRQAFMQSYDVLLNLSSITKIEEGEQNTFLFFLNDVTHEPMLLQTPDYVPVAHVNNKAYDAAHGSRFHNSENGRKLKMETTNQMLHYHSNMAMMLQLGRWFDDLREAGVYDNTRIIIVSDHGRHLGQIEELKLRGPDGDALITGPDGEVLDLEAYYPLLLVKDFNAHNLSTSDSFMTNADVPVMAFEDLIINPVNPFTGKQINNEEKFKHKQYISLSSEYDISVNNGNTFLPSGWISVEDDIWSPDNWDYYPGDRVLSEHQAK